MRKTSPSGTSNPAYAHSRPAIEIENLAFSWDRRARDILDIHQLTIPRKQKIFIRGASGSGKTTLLNLLGGILTPRSGMIRILGTDIVKMSAARRDTFRADHIGFIFQMFNLVPFLSLTENVTLPLKFSARRKERLPSVDMSPQREARRLLKALELDVSRLQNQAVSNLSIGQQQRVAAARALIGRPEIIIADEPTSALDADVQKHFLELLFEETDRNDATLVFVSHDTRLESMFDKVVILSDINQAAIQPNSI